MSSEQQVTAITWTVDETFPKQVADAAHGHPRASEAGHVEGFCRACAAIYVAVSEALTPDGNGSYSDWKEG